MKIDLEGYKDRIAKWAYCLGTRQEFKAEMLDNILEDLVNEVEYVAKETAEIHRRDRGSDRRDRGVDSSGSALAEANDFRERMGSSDG